MDIYIYSRETARFEVSTDTDGEVHLEFGDALNTHVYLSEMTAQRLLGELARLYPAPPLTDSDVDQLAARYAEEHAGEVVK